MEIEKFEFIAETLHARGKSKQGCKLVLVDGFRQCDAARKLNINPVLIAVSLKLYKKRYSRICELWQPENREGLTK